MFNLYFMIKVLHHLNCDPQDVVHSLVLLKGQTDVMTRGCYHSHIITAQLCSDPRKCNTSCEVYREKCGGPGGGGCLGVSRQWGSVDIIHFKDRHTETASVVH